MRYLFLVAVVFVSASLIAAEAPPERSFVGKKLTGITFVDTEGHTIDPSHYEGSVLVMLTGIPW